MSHFKTNLNPSELTFRDVSDDFVQAFVGDHSDVRLVVIAQREEHVHRSAQVLRWLGSRPAEQKIDLSQQKVLI